MKIIKLLLFVLIISSCSKSVEIDNPTGETLEIKIGTEQQISLKAYENKTISISGDNHEVYTNGELVGTLNLNGTGNVFINPTLSKYYIEEVAYGRDDREFMNNILKGNQQSRNGIEQNILILGDIPYIGYAKEDSSLVIKNIWNYGVQESLPNQIKTSADSGLKTKIYRDYLFKEHAQKIYDEALKED